MGHSTLPHTADDPSSEPKGPTGLGWSEFFHELGEGVQGTDDALRPEKQELLTLIESAVGNPEVGA